MKLLYEDKFGDSVLQFGVADAEQEKILVREQRVAVYKRENYYPETLVNDLDDYDKEATYLIAKFENDSKVLGSARYIRGKFGEKFPIQKAFDFEPPKQNIAAKDCAEIGKLVSEGSAKYNLGRLTITLGLFVAIAKHSEENGSILGYSFIKSRLLNSLLDMGIPFHRIKKYKLIYPDDGILKQYFYKHDDGVEPVYYFTSEIEKPTLRVLNNIKKTQKKSRAFSSYFWEKYFKVYDVLNLAIPYNDLLKDLIDEAKIIKTDIVLDVGSGTGNLDILIKKKCSKIIGIDNSKEGQEIHRTKDPNAELVLSDITEKFPFKDNTFDKIISNNTIYTLSSEKQLFSLREIFRVLKKDGTFVISNVIKDFSPIIIYKAHFIESVNQNGFIKTLFIMIKMLGPTIKMFYYNNKIKNAGLAGKYTFLSANEQENLLKEAGFRNISKVKYVYADQAIMHTARK